MQLEIGQPVSKNPPLAWMIDASHIVKDPLEDLIQSLEAIRLACAQEILQDAYRTDLLGLAQQTASPPLGMLNSGLQLYWLKYAKPEIFRKIRWSLHFPQFLSFLFTGLPLSEYTSIGCHTGLWDYLNHDYHPWVYAEGIDRILPPIVDTRTSINVCYKDRVIKTGVGIHDSSSTTQRQAQQGDSSYKESYHKLVIDLVDLQVEALHLAVGQTIIQKIFVDGGFIDNRLFIQLLSQKLPDYEVIPTSVPLGSALGGAIVMSDRQIHSKFF